MQRAPDIGLRKRRQGSVHEMAVEPFDRASEPTPGGRSTGLNNCVRVFNSEVLSVVHGD